MLSQTKKGERSTPQVIYLSMSHIKPGLNNLDWCLFTVEATLEIRLVVLYENKMGYFNDPARKVCGGWVGVVGWWLTPTTYIQLAGTGSTLTSGHGTYLSMQNIILPPSC